MGGTWHISDLHAAYAPLHYILLFPHRTPGWTPSLCLHPSGANNDREKHLTQVGFYSFHLHTCDSEFPIIHLGGQLFQQYLYDMWVSANQNRLHLMENNQQTLCASLYSGLQDVVAMRDDNLNLNDIGRCVILPSSYIEGPQYMN